MTYGAGGMLALSQCICGLLSIAQLWTGFGDFFVGGGKETMGMHVPLDDDMMLDKGFHACCVSPLVGVMVVTAMAFTNLYPMLGAYGGGFYTAVGGGVLIVTGAVMFKYIGPNYQVRLPAGVDHNAVYLFLSLCSHCPMLLQSLVGGEAYVGSGHMNLVGVFGYDFGSVGTLVGVGGFAYTGAGSMVLVGSPYFVSYAIYAFFGLGAAVAMPGE